jgi:hypothetical protein
MSEKNAHIKIISKTTRAANQEHKEEFEAREKEKKGKREKREKDKFHSRVHYTSVVLEVSVLAVLSVPSAPRLAAFIRA